MPCRSVHLGKQLLCAPQALGDVLGCAQQLAVVLELPLLCCWVRRAQQGLPLLTQVLCCILLNLCAGLPVGLLQA